MPVICFSAAGTVYMTVDANGVYVGQVVRFECFLPGSQPVEIHSWLMDEQILTLNSRITTSPPLYKNRLTIHGAVTSDSGIYTCVTPDGRNASQYLVVYCKKKRI